jgi:hypothetical protein
MTEDIIITIISVGLIIGALAIGHFFKNTNGMKIFIKLMTPFTWLKDRIDPNYWASRVGENSGLYDKARNSKSRKWVDSLEGWKWWTWQLGVGLIGVIVLEYLLNMIGMTMLPWK